MSDLVDRLVAHLELEDAGNDAFIGQTAEREFRTRIFGGQFSAQALMAAGRTVPPSSTPHSMHSYFVRPGDPEQPIRYEVERVRDGRAFQTRSVIAIQHGKTSFVLQASFHQDELGFDHELPAPAAPNPEELPTFLQRHEPYFKRMRPYHRIERPIDIRYVDEPPRNRALGPRPPYQRVWFRAVGSLPDTPLLHAAVLAYGSDSTVLEGNLLVHDINWEDEGLEGASLDHCIWFHRPFRADDWLLYDIAGPTTSGGRAFGEGRVYTRAGHHAATVIQEGLIRIRQAEASP